MAKNIKYDREDVVKKATDLYWEKGFHGTSMRNLQDVIDMRPGSIYATFGSKEGLYKEAIQYYADMGLQQMEDCRKATSSPLDALKMFMKKLIIESYHSAPSGMCMLAKTVAELTEENAELLAEAKRLLNVLEGAFVGVLLQAQERGELDNSIDTVALARYIQVQILGLRSYLRVNDNYSDSDMDRLIDELFEKGLS